MGRGSDLTLGFFRSIPAKAKNPFEAAIRLE
jgi:hypothetical protein